MNSKTIEDLVPVRLRIFELLGSGNRILFVVTQPGCVCHSSIRYDEWLTLETVQLLNLLNLWLVYVIDSVIVQISFTTPHRRSISFFGDYSLSSTTRGQVIALKSQFDLQSSCESKVLLLL